MLTEVLTMLAFGAEPLPLDWTWDELKSQWLLSSATRGGGDVISSDSSLPAPLERSSAAAFFGI